MTQVLHAGYVPAAIRCSSLDAECSPSPGYVFVDECSDIFILAVSNAS